jgi:hypothetical protein
MEGTQFNDVIMSTRAVELPICVERFGGIEGRKFNFISIASKDVRNSVVRRFIQALEQSLSWLCQQM